MIPVDPPIKQMIGGACELDTSFPGLNDADSAQSYSSSSSVFDEIHGLTLIPSFCSSLDPFSSLFRFPLKLRFSERQSRLQLGRFQLNLPEISSSRDFVPNAISSQGVRESSER